ANCKKHDVNPYHWLKYVLENIQSINHKNITDIYPNNYKKLTICTEKYLFNITIFTYYGVYEVTESDTLNPNSIKSNFNEFIKLFRQVILFSKISKDDIISSDFEYQFSSYIKLFCNVNQDENLYKTHKLKLILNKQSLDFKFNEVLFKYLK